MNGRPQEAGIELAPGSGLCQDAPGLHTQQTIAGAARQSASLGDFPPEAREVRVLLVEDDLTQVFLLRAALRDSASFKFALEVEATVEAAAARLEVSRFDVILTDLGLPDSQGLETFKRVFDAARGAPVMVMTAQDDPALSLQALAAGAQDYLLKRDVTGGLLVRSLRYSIERSRLQRQARQIQRMDAIGHLAGGVAHDFNNLLTVIQGYTSLLLASYQGDDRLTSALRPIQEAATRAELLTRQLLAFGCRQMMAKTDLDLNAVVMPAASRLEGMLKPGIKLELKCGQTLPPVHADASMIEQILVNLVLNSQDAMPQGGTLKIATFPVEIGPAAGLIHPERVPGRHLCLEVTDTGLGVPPELLPHIFEPFYTTKESRDGTVLGLGLASVYGIAKQHQGWVEVESQPGQGTSFRVYFPASARTAPASPEISGRAPEPGCRTILVVEDQENLRMLLEALLTSNGYRVIGAANGVEALAHWRAHSHGIDLLLTDMEMPGGLNGRELARALLTENPALPVIYSSGYSIALFGPKSLLEEGVNFLAKPYTPDRLIEIVRNTLAQRAGSGS